MSWLEEARRPLEENVTLRPSGSSRSPFPLSTPGNEKLFRLGFMENNLILKYLLTKTFLHQRNANIDRFDTSQMDCYHLPIGYKNYPKWHRFPFPDELLKNRRWLK